MERKYGHSWFWSREQDEMLVRLLQTDGIPIEQIAKRLGKSVGCIRYRANSLGIAALYRQKIASSRTIRKAAHSSKLALCTKRTDARNTEEEDDETMSGVSEAQLIADNKRLRESLRKSRELARIVYETVEANLHRLNVAAVKAPPKHRPKNVQTMHGLRSDAHVGEVVDRAWVQGIAGYDFEAYQKRLKTWTQMFLQFYNEDKHIGINRAVISWLGDQITGELIYRGQSHSIDRGVVDQILDSVHEEAQALLTLAREIPEIDVFCVSGNHGQIGGKRSELHYRSNMDYMFYRILQIVLRNQANVHFFISESPMMLVQHGRFNVCLQHGQNAGTNTLGIPYYGLDRAMRRLPRLFDMPVHITFTGHIHVPSMLDTNNIVTNGSMVGGTDLSVNKLLLASPPTQKIFLMDQFHGIHRMTDIVLADPVTLVPDNNGIYTHYFHPGNENSPEPEG